MIDRELLDILACPICKADVELRENGAHPGFSPGFPGRNAQAAKTHPRPEGRGFLAAGCKIVCKKCGKKYPVRDGIPVMLIDEAE